jgi:acetyl-CoA C-acetyltransferase
MQPDPPIAVVGCAIHAPRNPTQRSLEEAMYAMTRSALADGGMTIEDIGGIVVGANDQLDGRAISVMMASGSVGGVDRDILSTPSAAEHAFVLGALRIASGQFRTQLVAAWSPLETTSVPDALKLGTDPYFHRALPLDELSASALQATAMESATFGLHDVAVRIVARNRANGALAYPDRMAGPLEATWIQSGKPTRWPLTAGMVSPPAYGLVALILAEEGFVRDHGLDDACWIQGMGWATEPGFLGDRQLAELPSLAAATRQAYRSADVNDARSAFQVAEISDATPYQQLMACDGLGLCRRDEWTRADWEAFGSSAAIRINPSGGALSFNPVYCAGLVSIAEAANQVRGRAGNHQRRNVRRALAHAASGFAMQYNTVVVLGRDRARARQ